MISLTLQCCPTDLGAAFELVQLICEIQKGNRPESEFFLIFRKDCPAWVVKEFLKLCAGKFCRAAALQAINHATGWPAGSNMLAASAFIAMEMLRREQKAKNEAFLLFEPDCVPMSIDWLDKLTQAWEAAKAQGKEATGHWHQQGDADTLHMNGNAIFRTDFYDLHPTWLVGCGAQGWDYWFRDKLIPISCDTYAIYQNYGRQSITLEELERIEKHGRRPALLHGIKDSSGRRHAKTMILSHVSA
jgi:hypothetical protein